MQTPLACDRNVMPLAELAGQYHRSCQSAGRSPQYIRENTTLFERVFRACEWRSTSDMLTGCNAFEDYLIDLQSNTSAKTRNNVLCRVRAFAQWLVHRESLTRNPFAGIPVVRHFGGGGSRALSPPEMQAMIDVAEADERLPRPKHKSNRVEWYKLGRATGLRAREMSLLRVKDFNFEPQAACVRVPANVAKGRRIQRLPLSEFDAEWLGGMLRGKSPDELIFASKIPRQAVIDSDAKRAGIARPGETIGMHSFRKGFVSAIAASGAPQSVTQALARHTDPRLTERVYVDQSLLPLRHAVEALAATGYGKSEKIATKVMDKGEIPDSVFTRSPMTQTNTQHGLEAADSVSSPRHGLVALSTEDGGHSAASGRVCTCGKVSPVSGDESGRRDLNPLHVALELTQLANRLLQVALAMQGGSHGQHCNG